MRGGRRVGVDLSEGRQERESEYGQNTLYGIHRESIKIVLKKENYFHSVNR